MEKEEEIKIILTSDIKLISNKKVGYQYFLILELFKGSNISFKCNKRIPCFYCPKIMVP